MTPETALAIWTAVGAYFALGLVVGAILFLGGFRRVDALAADAPLLVKVIWLPGVAALWPIMLAKLFFPGKGRSA